MFAHKIATVVIMTVLLSYLRAKAQSSQYDRPLVTVSSSSDSSNSSASTMMNSSGMGMASAERSYSSSSSSGGGLYLMPPDQHKSKADLGNGRPMRPFSAVAVGFTINSLGAGFEVATPLSQGLNLRSIINVVDYGYKFSSHGGNYNAEVHFHSAQMSVDWFPFHGRFHISPGIMAFNNKLAAQVRVLAGQSFEFEDYGLDTGPGGGMQGSATATYNRKIAPVLMAGFGNILPRNGRHFTAPFEFGFVYPGAAQIDIHLYGATCNEDGCTDVSTDPQIQNLLIQKKNSLNDYLKMVQVYPIISMGLAYRF